MALKLSALLDEERFGIRMVASSTLTNQLVKGVTVIEWPEPARWTAPGYLVLTHGLALRGNAKRQHRFVEELHSAGAAAMAMWVPATFKSVPRVMIDRATELGLAILTIPYDLPSREITLFVMRTALSAEARNLSRAMTAQDYLLGALDEPEPLDALVERLHSVLRASVAVFSPVGRVLATAGGAPLEAMWTAACARPDVVPLERDWLLSTTVSVSGAPYAHLVVRLHQRPSAADYPAAVAHFAARVMQMIGLASHAAVEKERAVRGATLHELLNVDVPDREMLERLEVLGFASSDEARILVAATIGPADRAAVAVGTLYARRHITCLVHAYQRELVALVGDHEPESDLLESLVTGEKPVLAHVGIGLPTRVSQGVRQTLREAQIVLLRARRDHRAVESFEDLGLADTLLSYQPLDRLRSASQLLTPLRTARPDLFDTLVAYLERDCNVLHTASALHLHPNSLRYRLSVIEKILGRSLSSVDTLLEITLALRIDAIVRTDMKPSED